MKKIQILGAAFFAVLAFGAVSAVSASAHLWLTLSGTDITSKTAVDGYSTDLTLITTKLPALLGGGEVQVLCDGASQGFVGPGAEDETTLLEELAPGTKKDKEIDCTVKVSTNSLCKTGELALMTPINLPWHTELVLTGTGLVLDDITAPTGGKTVGYTISCKGLSNTCEVSLELIDLKGNTTEGADFEFKKYEKATCKSGGEGFAEGLTLILGVLAN